MGYTQPNSYRFGCSFAASEEPSVSLFELLIAFLILTFAIALPFVYARLVTGGRTIERRPLPALDQLNAALARAAETGKPIHLSPGAGALHGATIDPESLAGLVLAQRIASAAARRGATITASSGDAVSHLALRGMIRVAYRNAGYSEDFQPDNIHLYADHDPLAFAAGLGNRYVAETMEASVTVGAFGETYLLAGEQGRQHLIPQVAGTTNPISLAAAILTADGTLLGEEIYAAEAYIAPTPLGIARLLTHDAIRLLLIIIIIVGLILVSLQDFGILPGSFPLLPTR
jgi:hypothetical protein